MTKKSPTTNVRQKAANNSKKSSLSKKEFSVIEDEQLCRSYLSISLNAIRGAQKSGPLWSRITKHYQESVTDDTVDRNTLSLSTRWEVIDTAVLKYVGLMTQVKRSPFCSPDEELNESMAGQFYTAEMNTNFDLVHCYRILAKQPRWQVYLPGYSSTKTQRPKVKKAAAIVIDDDERPSVLPTRATKRNNTENQGSLKRKHEDVIEILSSDEERTIRNKSKSTESGEQSIEGTQKKSKLDK